MPIPHRRVIKNQLIALLQENGAMTPNDVYAMFAQIWELSPTESMATRDGRALYKNEIRWARQELVLEGLLDTPSQSGRGIWKVKKAHFSAPNEYDEEAVSDLVEGAVKKISVNSYERNKEARDKCLAVHGYSCTVCGFDFEEAYGSIGKECIHVHHLIEISTIASKYVVKPEKDLVPVCPNCHYIIHRRRPAFTILEVKAMLKHKKSS